MDERLVRVIEDWMLRERRNQRFLAREAGIAEETLSRILGDKYVPGRRVMAKLERAMGLERGALAALVEQDKANAGGER